LIEIADASPVQATAGNLSVVSAFSEASGVAGFSDDDGFDDILFAAAYVIKLFKPLDFPTTLAPRGGAENKVKRKTVPFPSD
jgi:hypothetical protein